MENFVTHFGLLVLFASCFHTCHCNRSYLCCSVVSKYFLCFVSVDSFGAECDDRKCPKDLCCSSRTNPRSAQDGTQPHTTQPVDVCRAWEEQLRATSVEGIFDATDKSVGNAGNEKLVLDNKSILTTVCPADSTSRIQKRGWFAHFLPNRVIPLATNF